MPPETTEARLERRASPRVAVAGSVIVRLDGAAPGRLVDLSAGGVRFTPSPGVAPYAVGTRVMIDLRLDGARFGWFRFGAVISRSSPDETAATFSDVPPEFAAAVVSELRTAAASAETPGVLLVDLDPPRRVLVAAALRVAGCDVREVTTPLEAISYLGDSQARPWIVAIADTVPATVADELRAHVRDDHALVRLVAVSEATAATDAEDSRLPTRDPLDLSDRIARLVASRLDPVPAAPPASVDDGALGPERGDVVRARVLTG